MKKAIRPAIFKGRQTDPELIVCAVRWYLRYPLSLRDVEELHSERGLEADHTTIWRWVQRYGPELEERLRRHLKPTNKSWRSPRCTPRSAFDCSGPHEQLLDRFRCMEPCAPVVSPRLDGALLHEHRLRWLRVERRRLLNRQD